MIENESILDSMKMKINEIIGILYVWVPPTLSLFFLLVVLAAILF